MPDRLPGHTKRPKTVPGEPDRFASYQFPDTRDAREGIVNLANIRSPQSNGDVKRIPRPCQPAPRPGAPPRRRPYFVTTRRKPSLGPPPYAPCVELGWVGSSPPV